MRNTSTDFSLSVTICIINSYDTKWASGIQIILTGTKLLSIAVIIVGGCVRMGQGEKSRYVLNSDTPLLYSRWLNSVIYSA